MEQHTLLWSLPLECLDTILSFHIGDNGVLKLILSGDKRLIHKVSRTSRLSICWTKTGFISWKSVSPLVKTFSKLDSLLVTAWSPFTLTQGPVNAGIFPTSLRKLTLQYEGSSVLLTAFHAPILFEPLVSLEEFTLQDEFVSIEPTISLSHFPSSLRCLQVLGCHRRASTTYFYYSRFEDLSLLPKNLETFHWHPLCTESVSTFVWPEGLLPFLTDLSIRVNTAQYVDISAIGTQLKRLEFQGLDIISDSVRLLQRDAPIKEHLPNLQSLSSPCFVLHQWSAFQHLPPGLVELVASLAEDALNGAEAWNALVQVNLESVAKDGSLLHAAPKNIRKLEEYAEFNRTATRPFPNLMTLLELGIPPDTHAKVVHISHLPPSNPFNLVSLQLTDNFTIDQVALLPPTLESLIIYISSLDVMHAIVKRDHLVSGSKLKKLDLFIVEFDRKIIPIDASTIPLNLEYLKISLPDVALSVSLNKHHHLTTFQIVGAPFCELLPKLPSNLEMLIVTLSDFINHANPDEAMTLYRMNEFLPRLKHLELYATRKHDGEENHWINFISRENPPRLSMSRWISLPWRVKKFYANYYLKLPLTSYRRGCELFALSCLPRTLSVIRIPATLDFTLQSVGFWISLKRVSLGILKYQISLLGLPMLNWGIPDVSDPLIAALPTQLSYFNVGRDSLAGICDCIMRNTAGYAQLEFDAPADRYNFWWLEPSHHVSNALSWLLIAQFAPATWMQKPFLRAFMLCNVVGSFVAAPIVAAQIYSSGLLVPSLASKIPNSISITLQTGLLFSLPVNFMLSYALGSNNVGRLARGATIGVAALIGVLRNLGIQALRR